MRDARSDVDLQHLAATDPTGAIVVAVMAVSEASARAEPGRAARALVALATAHRNLFAYDDAEQALATAVPLATQSGPVEASLVQRAVAALAIERGDLVRATRALRAAGDDHPEAQLLAGLVAEQRGRLGAAEAHYRAGLARLDGFDRPDGEPPVGAPAHGALATKLHNNLGTLLAELGDFDGARHHLERAVAASGPDDRGAVAVIEHNLGWLALRAGRLAEGLARFEMAGAAFDALGTPPLDHLLDRLEALTTMRAAGEGVALADELLADPAVARYRMRFGEVLLRRARLLLLAGRPDTALEAAAAAEATFRQQRRPAWAAWATLVAAEAALTIPATTAPTAAPTTAPTAMRLAKAAMALERAGFASASIDGWLAAGRLAVRAGDGAEASRAFERATTLAAGGAVLDRVKGQLARAAAAAVAGDHPAVRTAATAGLRELDAYRDALGSIELRALAAGHGDELAGLALRAALADGRPATVFTWIERPRARSIGTTRPTAPAPALAPLLVELRAIVARQRPGSGATGAELASLRHEQLRLEARVRRVSRAVGHEQRPGAEAPSLAEVQQRLGTGGLVEVGIDGDQIVAVVATAHRSRLVPLADRATVVGALDALQFALNRLARAPDDRQLAWAAVARDRALADLAAGLWTPIAPLLTDSDEIVVVPPPFLLGVPWGALDGVDDRPVIVAPSAAVWRNGRERSRPANGTGRVSLVAGPGLEHADAEIVALAGIHPDARAIAAADASVRLVVAAIDSVGVAHLACHGSFRADNPLLSTLELADGPLTVHDLETLAEPPRTIVLAACDIGRSGPLGGDELLGALSVLLGIGTTTVVAAAVPVPDADTTALMIGLHRGLAAGLPAHRALAAARATMAVDPDPRASVVALAFNAYGSV